MKSFIIYRTAGGNIFGDWYFSNFDTVEEQEKELDQEFADRYEGVDMQNKHYPRHEVSSIEAADWNMATLLVGDLNGCPHCSAELAELGYTDEQVCQMQLA